MRRFDRTTLLGVAASVALVVGAYLPWITENSEHTGAPPVLITGMDAGFAGLDVALVGAAAVAFLASFLVRRRGARATVFLLTGVFSTLVCAELVQDSLVGLGSGTPFVPDMGWYVTLLGALVLLSTGGAYALSELRGAAPARASWRP